MNKCFLYLSFNIKDNHNSLIVEFFIICLCFLKLECCKSIHFANLLIWLFDLFLIGFILFSSEFSIFFLFSKYSKIYLELDTENRERICTYYEELMDIVGLESSEGLLNEFMYDFDFSE